jgi:hypothetical protein
VETIPLVCGKKSTSGDEGVFVCCKYAVISEEISCMVSGMGALASSANVFG